MKTAILLIAAGASRRLGQPKQLLSYRGNTLLEHSIQQCLNSQIGAVFLVLGAYYEAIFKEIAHLQASSEMTVLYHPNWAAGMGSSIAFGMQKIRANGDYSGVIISLADQPFLHADLFRNIIQQQAPIIASKYAIGNGPPVYFDSQYFPQLIDLQGDNGAKSIIQANKNSIQFIDFPRGNIDIDSPEDLPFLKD